MERTIKTTGQTWQGRLLSFAPYILCGVILVLLPPFMSTHIQSMLTKALIFGIFAMSLNILYGYTGLFSLGHAAYFGAAGYTMGILVVKYGISSFWIVAPAGILMAAVLALIFGVIALRTYLIYFLLVTFALGQLVYSIAWKWRDMTGGSDGLAGIPRPDLGFPISWNTTTFYYFIVVVLIICIILLYRFVNSPLGHALQGIRESETRMRLLGYNTWIYKYIAFVVGGVFAGVAGVLFAYSNGLMVPSHAGLMTSSAVMLMVIIGSDRVFWGPIIGAILIVFLEHYASIYLPERWPLILGGAFVIAVMLLRGGISVYLIKLWNRIKPGYRYGSIKS